MIDHKINNLSEENDVYSREYLFSDVHPKLVPEPGYADTS